MKEQRQESTTVAYLRRGTLLIRNFERDTGRKWENEPLAVAEWFEAKAPALRKSSFRLYKASLTAFMQENGPVEVAHRIRNLSQSLAGLHTKDSATSSDKLKKVPLDIFYAVIGELATSRSSYASMLANLIYCNSIVGLRPVEWDNLSMDGKKLYCTNAKHSFGRGRTGKRIIDLSSFDESVLHSFATMITCIADCKEKGITFRQMYSSCRQLLYRIQLKLFPQMKGRLSLYSTRHQSVANYKYAGASREEIAVMFGHTSLKTAMHEYAKKRSGRSMESLPVAQDAVFGDTPVPTPQI